jgi:hypothetical protein
MKKLRIKLKGGAEYDALTDTKRWYCYLSRAGVAKKIKRGYNKRLRKHIRLYDKSKVQYSDGDNT